MKSRLTLLLIALVVAGCSETKGVQTWPDVADTPETSASSGVIDETAWREELFGPNGAGISDEQWEDYRDNIVDACRRPARGFASFFTGVIDSTPVDDGERSDTIQDMRTSVTYACPGRLPEFQQVIADLPAQTETPPATSSRPPTGPST